MILRFLILMMVFRVGTAAGQDCTGFGSGKIGHQEILDRFGPAVVQVQNIGTAYLIDSNSGYLLTDGHVLDQLVEADKPFEVVLGYAPYTHLEFKIVNRPKTPDIALIQLIQTDAMKDVRALDIAFEAPDADDDLFAMGYPHFGQQAEVTLSYTAAKVSGKPKNGFIQVTHPEAPGDSGGPLVDARGDVVAICQEEIGAGQAGRYLPLASVTNVIGSIPVSSRMTQIGQSVLEGKSDIKELMQTFKRAAQNPTNVEIYVWATHHPNSPEFLKNVAQFIGCPIMPAVKERNIVDALVGFMPVLQSEEQGRTQLELAQREFKLGGQDAPQLATASLKAFAKAASTTSEEPSAQTANTLAGVAEIAESLGAEQDSVQVVTQKALVAYEAAHDYSNADKLADKLGPPNAPSVVSVTIDGHTFLPEQNKTASFDSPQTPNSERDELQLGNKTQVRPVGSKPKHAHEVKVVFDYDFTRTRVCEEGMKRRCVDHFNVLETNSYSRSDVLFCIRMQPGFKNSIQHITDSINVPSKFSGKTEIAIVAVAADGTESNPKSSSVFVKCLHSWKCWVFFLAA
jgi:hypothetical protein